MFRYKKEEAFQLSILSLFAPAVISDVKRVFSSPSDITFEAVMQKKDGSSFHGLIHKSVFISGNDKTCIISCQDVSRMRLIDRELRQNRDELEAIFDNEYVGIGLVGKDRRIIRANKKLAFLCGYEKSEDIIGLGMSDFHLDKEQNSFFQELYRTSLAEHKHVQLDFQFKHRDGSPRWMSVSGMMIGRNLPPDEEERILWILDDITERKSMERKLNEANLELETIFDNTMMGILVLKGYRKIYRVNKQFLRMFGYESEEEWIGESVRKLHLSDGNFREFGEKFYDLLVNHEVLEVEYQLKKKDGSPIWIAISGKAMDPVSPCDLSKGVVWIIQDINERKKNEAELQRLATTDPLTGILNRRSFTNLASREFEIRCRYQTPLSLLMLDIDHFKKINDQYGHNCGDTALRLFSRLCKREIRSTDIFGRFGGEEFAILLLGLDQRDARQVAERIRRSIERETPDESESAPAMTVSIGLVTVSEEDTLESTLSKADKLMYKAKRSGRNRICSQ